MGGSSVQQGRVGVDFLTEFREFKKDSNGLVLQ